MKTMRALLQKEAWMKGILGFAAFVLVFAFSVFTSEAAEGKVIADTAKIRAEASTSSEVVGSTVKDKTIDIVGAVKDASGTVWYKVPNGNNTYGYIRSDLVETSEEIQVETTASTASTGSDTGENTSKPADTVPTSIGETPATVAVDSAVIRSGASTAHSAITSLTKGTAITLIGEANDSAGKKWYQITCDKNGSTVEGYIRSDLVTVSESSGAEAPEGSEENTAEGEETEGQEEGGAPEEAEEQQEPAEEEHNDYEIVYKDETYWLYDNTNSTMMSVTKVLEMVNQINDDESSLESQLKNEKIIIIILAVIIAILVIAVTILIFKLKDAYYYEDYEEEEEEFEEEPEPVVSKKKRTADEALEEPAPVKKKKGKESVSEEAAEDTVKRKPKQEAELQAAEEKKTAKKPVQRKSQNFLIDDDEFEFEFLNMDDKDL